MLPAARKSLSGNQYSAFLDQVSRRLQLVGWLSLAVLVGTGMFQMSASPSYRGFLAINNPWSIALDSKGNLYVADSKNHRVQKLIRKASATRGGA